MTAVDAIIVTAIGVEREAVRSHLSELMSVRAASTVADVGIFDTGYGTLRVAVIESGPGNVQAGLLSAAPIQQFKPTLVMMVGIAGSLKDLEVGDVVASSKPYWIEPAKAVSVIDEDGNRRSELRRRPDVGAVTDRLVQVSRLVTADASWQELPDGGTATRLDGTRARAFVAPTVASETLITDLESNEVREIRKRFSDAVVVAMEDYGVARAAAQSEGTAFLSVRSASDKCGNKDVVDAAGSQPLAATNAAAFAFAVLSYDHRLRVTEDDQKGANIPGPPSSSGRGHVDIHHLADVLADLYPSGPTHNEIWTEAGGDLSKLTLEGSGRARWFAALRLLVRGGGGEDISFESLLSAAANEFPSSHRLRAVLEDSYLESGN